MDEHKPLEGIRVVDFCWVLAGPLGTRILANFGAEVIRVESMASPDAFRVRPRPAGSDSLDLGYWFNDVNAGKRSLTLDLGTPRGRSLVLDLIAESDVVTNNFRPGVLERLGLGYEVARARNRGIIYVHLPGCGKEGPWANRATMGGMLTAAAGVNTLMGFSESPPYGMGCAYPDFSSPYLLASSVAAALIERGQAGDGREIWINQLSTVVSFLGTEWLAYSDSGTQPPPSENHDPNYAPHGVFPTKGSDDWIAIAIENDEQWRRLCEIAGRKDLGSDERLASLAGRKANEAELDHFLASWTQQFDRWTLAELLQQRSIPAAAVENLADMCDRDPQLADHYRRIRQPGEPDVVLTIDREAIRFAGALESIERAPMLGEHNEYVLKQILGLSDEDYVQLLIDEVIR